nr:MAG TPA: Putative viral replication protein [Cressdnaviricota sp.]
MERNVGIVLPVSVGLALFFLEGVRCVGVFWKMPNGAKRWCFTLNNYLESDFSRICSWASSSCVFAVIARERGDSGTPHLQGYLEFSAKRALPFLKSGVSNRAHFEVARGSAAENVTYCSKQDPDPFQCGEPRACSTAAARSSLRERCDEAIQLARDGKLCDVPSDLLLRHFKVLQTLSREAEWSRSRLSVSCPEIVLRPWQIKLLDTLHGTPDSRSILFIEDTLGGGGKTTFTRFLQCKFPDDLQTLHPAKGTDLAFILRPCRIYVLDIPRSSNAFVSWGTIEAIKNGHVFSSKYECQEKIFPIPHVVVMCNSLPSDECLSADRFDVVKI